MILEQVEEDTLGGPSPLLQSGMCKARVCGAV